MGVSPQTSGPATTSRRRLLLFMALLVVAVGITAAYFLRRRELRRNESGNGGTSIPSAGSGTTDTSSSPRNSRKSVAILGFKNLSGRPNTAWLSTALSEMLTSELAAGEKLLTISGESVARVKNDLSLPETDSLASDTLARVHNNLGSDYVVLGSFLDLGDGSEVGVDLRFRTLPPDKWLPP